MVWWVGSYEYSGITARHFERRGGVINLPYGGEFDETELIRHIETSGFNSMIQGQQAVAYKSHTKPHSLDYWLRQFAANPDTKQAENSVINDLVATGKFKIERGIKCPDSGRLCNGILLI